MTEIVVVTVWLALCTNGMMQTKPLFEEHAAAFVVFLGSPFVAVYRSGMSCNTNQNHLVRPGRNTSRVLAPPGGKSSFSLGVAPTPPRKKKQPPKEDADKEATLQRDTTTDPKLDETQTGTVVAEEEPEQPTAKGKPESRARNEQSVSANAFVTGANMNGGCVMTGRPTSRVLAPPGGHSNFKLG